MGFREAILSALSSLLTQKFKTFLTLLGIIIGITTLITVVTLIEGANFYVSDKIADLGPNVFQLSQFPRVSLNYNEYLKAMKWKRIEHADYLYLLEKSRNPLRIGFSCSANDLIRYRDQTFPSTAVRGVSTNMIDIEKKEIQDGRFVSEADAEMRRQVCVLGADIVEKLFVREDPISKKILVGGREFLVIGTIKPLGSVFGNSRDKFVIIPAPTLFKIYGSRRRVAIYCQARSQDEVEPTIDEIVHLMRIRRHVAEGDPNNFSITTAETIMGIYRTVTSSFFLVTIIISSISLLVGGVVIMNIMLVSVKERTREIGVRKAMGARSRDILMQFLSEAVTICLVGGALGILLGLSIAKLVELLTPFPANIRIVVVVLGFAVSTCVGVFFGIYPAYRAAELDPIEALRYE
jgi:putative ABC transport system permease protein